MVPLYNCLSLTRAMVDSLRATLPAGLSYEVVLVDDGSTDGTRDWLRSLRPPFRVVLNDRNLGYAGANNRGAALATGKNLLLLNNDLVFPPRWLEPMLAAQGWLGARAGVVGNVQRDAATGAVDHSGIFINHKGKPEHDRALPLRALLPHPFCLRPVTAVTGACLLVDRRRFLAAGGLCEDYVNGCEDVDLAFRLARDGLRHVVALKSAVRHHVSSSPGRKRHDEANTYLLAQRWRDMLVQHAARDWCRHFLRSEWASPTASPGYRTAARALCHLLRLRRHPPTAAVPAMHAAIDHEVRRWRRMFGEAEESPPRLCEPRVV